MRKEVEVAADQAPRRSKQTRPVRSRIPKVKDRLVSQLESKIRRAEVEKRLLVTKGQIETLGAVLKDMKGTVTRDQIWLAQEDVRV